MASVLTSVFAALDSGAWDIAELARWANGSIRSLSQPPSWLIDLGMCMTIDEAVAIVRAEMQRQSVMLPSNYGDLMAGLILMRVKKGDLSESNARRSLVDVVDAYGSTFTDAEGAYKIDFAQPVCQQVQASSEAMLSALAKGLSEFEQGRSS
jgi:hypothetical protein